jgi:hypothetical protein
MISQKRRTDFDVDRLVIGHFSRDRPEIISNARPVPDRRWPVGFPTAPARGPSGIAV